MQLGSDECSEECADDEAKADWGDDAELGVGGLFVGVENAVVGGFEEGAEVAGDEGGVVGDLVELLKGGDLYGGGDGDEDDDGWRREVGRSCTCDQERDHLKQEGDTVGPAGLREMTEDGPAEQDAAGEGDERREVAKGLGGVAGEQGDAKQDGVAGHGGGEDMAVEDVDDGVEHAAGNGEQGCGEDVTGCRRQGSGRLWCRDELGCAVWQRRDVRLDTQQV